MKRDSNRYATSILQDDVGERCFLCNREGIELVRHEIFEGVGRREKCKEFGLWVTLCVNCHSRVHSNPAGKDAKFLDEYAEREALATYDWTIKDFIREFGKNYIDFGEGGEP